MANPLQKYGVKFAATYIGEGIVNSSGGLKQGEIYEGRLNLAVDVDLEKLASIDKLTFHANMFQIHGDGLTRSNLQNFFVVSGIEALPSTRLYEDYFEKQWGNKKISLKFGQLAADSEFFNTKCTDVFTNASMGWPAITSLDFPSGGPSVGGRGYEVARKCHRPTVGPRRHIRRRPGGTRAGRSSGA